MRRMVAPHVWADEGPQMVYSPGRMVSAVPLAAAVRIVAEPWPVPHPHGTPISRTAEYRRAYERRRAEG